MHEKHDMLVRAVDRIQTPFCIIDSDVTHIRYANTRFGEFFGLDVKDHSLTSSLSDYFSRIVKLGLAPEHLNFEQFKDFVREKFDTKTDVQFTRKISDGRYFRLEIYPEDQNDIVVIYTDVTELERAVRSAKKAEVAKSAFMANMSHEIRTPMNGVLGMAQILSGTELTDYQDKCVNIIQSSGASLITIINDILDFSKIDAGQISINPESFNLHSAIEDVMALLGQSARAKNVELIVDIAADIPGGFVGDIGRIRQVLINLIGNAIKFTAKGYVKLAVRGKSIGPAIDLRFEIQDTGIGIEPHKLGRIFNQFEQADNSTTRQFGGTGLGLTISRRLIDAMGGAIDVSSKPGHGSVFTISLALPIDTSVSLPADTFTSFNNLPILIVDDLEVNRNIAAEQIKQMGGRPFAVSNAKDALALMKRAALKNYQFPAVLSDYQMPGMDGLQFIAAVRADAQIAQTPIMLLSSVELSELRPHLSKYGVEQAITKPAAIKDIYTGLSKILKTQVATQTSKAPKTPPQPLVNTPAEQNNKIRILAADDDEVNRLVITEMLKSDHISLTIVQDGREALDAFRFKHFDIILMDISMPVMDGVAATTEIRQIEHKNNLPLTPIIATTAHAMEHDRDRFIAAGMDDYIAKPLQKDALLGLVNKWVSGDKAAWLNVA